MEKAILFKWLSAGTISIPHVLFQHYRDIGLEDDECMLLLHVHTFIESKNPFPTPEQLAERMSLSSSRCIVLLRKLVQHGYLQIQQYEEKENHMYYEAYSLNALWEKLVDHLSQETASNAQEAQLAQESNLYTIYEGEFGRPLSPMECETLKIWLDQDHHSPELITAALKEAVITGKVNFRYIDRILFEWKKNNVTTAQQAREHGEKFRNYQGKKAVRSDSAPPQQPISAPMYNWLDQ
ncbi:DnaD and phage-associated domain-containing protein [Fictibacillus macauensis ZFHKF-1]|uniref:DnaD and phage-associated domain-containing protein n=1 Tax=Fictibacillus macauensis ZFHKF-1 TaxID=1196324 RepID=I8UIA7_9BACL|nr:DnaD domain-containing protein [Fictibacillus macauensis]EIT86625.1 DnaD and phage-associated domain-containing protein [Fictibacillus macauensis ZFHKF-1]